MTPKPPRPPVADRRPHAHILHGDVRDDPYHWLRADNWQEVMRAPETLPADIRAYLEAENAYTAAVMALTEKLQENLVAEMRGRIKEDDASVPAPDGPFAYYTGYRAGGQHPLFCRRLRDGGPETVLLDGDAQSEGHTFFQIGGVAHAPDHARIAYGVDTRGSEFYTLRIRDAATGADLPDRIPDTTGHGVWAADGQTLFYTRLDDSHRQNRIFRHRLGDPPDHDVLVYEESDPGYFVGVGLTESRRFIVIDTHDHQTSELRVIPADAPDTPPRLVAPREPGVEYDLSDHGDSFLILTNADGAEDFKLVRAPIAAPERANWTDVVPHAPGRLILQHTVFADHWVRMERVEGLPRIVVTRLGADSTLGASHTIAMAEEAYSLGLMPGYEYDTATLRFSYASPTTPTQVFDYDMNARTRTLRKTQEVPSGHDPAAYVTRRITIPAPDGAEVPVTLLYAKDTPRDGSAPVLLYGYGSYGITIPAGFATARLSLVDRGFIYAIAHVRGGKDRGYGWYTDGKRDRKMNTFTDFIAVAEGLVARGLTRRGAIVAEGGSAGGLLMGAVANMAPELFGGIIAEVPFVDTLTTICDASLPLTPPEWPEWGNPIADPAAYAAIKAYAPYDNVRAQAYPPMLVTAGLTDPRVTYWEPAKWVARLRALKTDANPLLLKTHMEAGHKGAAGRFEHLKDIALAYAFALMVSGRMA